MNKGYIYILTNPSFPDYVKIGYAMTLKDDFSNSIEVNASLLRLGFTPHMK